MLLGRRHNLCQNPFVAAHLRDLEQPSRGRSLRTFRFLVGALLLFFLPGVAVAIWRLGQAFVARGHLVLPAVAGALAGVLLEHVVLRRYPVVGVFEHELTHAIAGLFFLRSIRGFVVTRRRGGLVRHTSGFGGRVGDDFIGLAPYVLPTFTAAVVLVQPLVQRQQLAWWAALVGLTFGYHLWSTLHELRHNWSSEVFTAVDGRSTHTDIGRRGFLYSAIYIVTVTLGLHGLLLGIFLHGYPGAVAWARLAWPPTQATGYWILALGAKGLSAIRVF